MRWAVLQNKGGELHTVVAGASTPRRECCNRWKVVLPSAGRAAANGQRWPPVVLPPSGGGATNQREGELQSTLRGAAMVRGRSCKGVPPMLQGSTAGATSPSRSTVVVLQARG
jgi:hypothetical protein